MPLVFLSLEGESLKKNNNECHNILLFFNYVYFIQHKPQK